MTVLVTGGAGYVGSHVVYALLEAGLEPVVLDRAGGGWQVRVPEGARAVVADIGDFDAVSGAIALNGVTQVVHLAASASVPASVSDPFGYYRNNVAASLCLLEACLAGGVGEIVFASSSAVYGTPDALPVKEDAPLRPESPYGRSKAMTEAMLADAGALGMRHVALRCFNIAGADPAGRAGQSTPGAAHLIKVACEAVTGRRAGVSVFGSDWPTPDGTCVRDYVHVADLADAVVLSLARLSSGGGSLVANLGSGKGRSVREILDAVDAASGEPLARTGLARRPGDPAAVVADVSLAARELGWKPVRSSLEEMVGSALAWERRLSLASS